MLCAMQSRTTDQFLNFRAGGQECNIIWDVQTPGVCVWGGGLYISHHIVVFSFFFTATLACPLLCFFLCFYISARIKKKFKGGGGGLFTKMMKGETKGRTMARRALTQRERTQRDRV